MELTLDGLMVHVATGGRPFDPSLPAVVFLHGAGMDHTVWSLQARYFAHRGYAVLVPDLAGHGRSEGEAKESIAEWADWTVGLLQSAGLQQAILVGHSMGALIALETARRHPASVTAIALLGVASRMPVHPDLLQAAAENDRKAAALISDWGFGPSGHYGGARVPGLYLAWAGERLIERAKPGSLYRDLAACNAHQVEAEGVSCPALLILGALDRMTPAKAGLKLAAAIQGAESEAIPGSGHMMMLEKPDETLDALRRFMARLAQEGRQSA